MILKQATISCALILGASLTASAERGEKSALNLAGKILAENGIAMEAPERLVSDVLGQPTPGTSGLIDKFQISKIEQPSVSSLSTFRKFVSSALENSDSDPEALWVIETLKIGKGDFHALDLRRLLNGRFNDHFELDLSISDAEAANQSTQNQHDYYLRLIVTDYESLQSGSADANEKNAAKAAAHFLPYGGSSERAKRQGRQDWHQAHMDRAAAMVKELAEDSRFQLNLVELRSAYDYSLKLLAIADAANSEVLIIGWLLTP